MSRKKRQKRHRARCLRTYRRVAHQSHGTCEFCREEINAGDEYEGAVYTNGREFWVKKEHIYCLPWDHDETYRHYEEIANQEESEASDLPKAA
ncbi:MAG: hypothetical protein AAB638_03735 [Patescibacteria group bacterium]